MDRQCADCGVSPMRGHVTHLWNCKSLPKILTGQDLIDWVRTQRDRHLNLELNAANEKDRQLAAYRAGEAEGFRMVLERIDPEFGKPITIATCPGKKRAQEPG